MEVASRLARSVGGMVSSERASANGARSLPRPPTVNASADGRRSGEVMDALVAQDKRYTYVLFDEWIHLFGLVSANDPITFPTSEDRAR